MKHSQIITFSLLAVIAVALLFYSYGCAAKNETAATDTHSEHSSEMHEESGDDGHEGHTTSHEVMLRKAKKEEIGKKTVCPVMNGEHAVKEGTDVAEYKGKAYYFCCPGCAPEFQKDLDKFTGKK